MKNGTLKSEHFGIFLIIIAVIIGLVGYERLYDYGQLMYIVFGVLVGLGLTFIIFRKEFQKIMDKLSHDEWAVYLFVFIALAFILDYLTTTYNIEFIYTLIAYIPLGLIIGYGLRRILKIR